MRDLLFDVCQRFLWHQSDSASCEWHTRTV